MVVQIGVLISFQDLVEEGVLRASVVPDEAMACQ
jgi:hypothetical protein